MKKSAELCKQYIDAGIELVIGEKLDTLTRAIMKRKQLHVAARKRAPEAQISEAWQKKRQHVEIHRLNRCMAGASHGKTQLLQQGNPFETEPRREDYA
eukprot:1882162-Pyramimonas_sp.AAC.1